MTASSRRLNRLQSAIRCDLPSFRQNIRRRYRHCCAADHLVDRRCVDRFAGRRIRRSAVEDRRGDCRGSR